MNSQLVVQRLEPTPLRLAVLHMNHPGKAIISREGSEGGKGPSQPLHPSRDNLSLFVSSAAKNPVGHPLLRSQAAALLDSSPSLTRNHSVEPRTAPMNADKDKRRNRLERARRSITPNGVRADHDSLRATALIPAICAIRGCFLPHNSGLE
jgi:hypothetical protein